MIARLWHGRTLVEKTTDYLAFLTERAVPDYSGVNGCLGVYLFHRIEGNVTHFQTLTFWSSEEEIRAFAGDEVLRAKYYPEDQEYLLEFEEQVLHYEVTEGCPLNAVCQV